MWSPTILSNVLAIFTQFPSYLIITQLQPTPLTIMTYSKSTSFYDTIDTKINNKFNSYKKANQNDIRKANLIETFKGSSTELSGKIFTKEPTQVSIYDDSFKDLLKYTGLKYDQ